MYMPPRDRVGVVPVEQIVVDQFQSGHDVRDRIGDGLTVNALRDGLGWKVRQFDA